MSARSGRKLIARCAFAIWAVTLVVFSWVLQGTVGYQAFAANFPMVNDLRSAILPWFTRPYIF